jgi:Ni2+-binding GTPase involved in maturation of urease and hydrogenase
MERDSKRMRGEGQFIFTNLLTGVGLVDVKWVQQFLLSRTG